MSEVAMMVHTTRFGAIEVAPADVLHFPESLIGLAGHEYALLPRPGGPFLWLQSLTHPGIALPLTNPHRFFPGFALELDEAEAERLGVGGEESSDVYVTVRAAPVPGDCTANLRAPILVLGEPGETPRRAHQVVNAAPGVALRTPLFGRS